MSRKKLIAIGCSFTRKTSFTQDTFNPVVHLPGFFHVWPTLLSEKLDMDCLNLGLGSMGNEYISAKLVDTILAEKKEDIGLVVLMWSEWQRIDYLDIEGVWKSVVREGDDWNIMLEYNNTYDATMKSLRYFLMAQMLLKDIPYLMIQGVDTTQYDLERKAKDIWIQTFLNSKIFDEIDEKKFIGWPIMQELGGYNVNDILNKLDPEQKELRVSYENNHPNAEGHKIMSQEIYDAYEKIYI